MNWPHKKSKTDNATNYGVGGEDIPTSRLVGRMLMMNWRYRWHCLRVIGIHAMVEFLRTILPAIAGLALAAIGDMATRRKETRWPETDWPMGLVPPDNWSDARVYLTVGALFIATAIILLALTYWVSYSRAALVRKVIVRLRSDVYDKMQRLSFKFFDSNESGSIINRVTADVQAVRMFTDRVVMQLVILVLSMVIFLSYMFYIDVKLTLACLVIMPVMAFVTSIFSQSVKPKFRENRKIFDKLVLGLSEFAQGVRVLKGFSREDETVSQLHGKSNDVKAQKQQIFNLMSLFIPGTQVLMNANIIILLSYGGYRTIYGNLPLEQGLFVFAIILQQFSQRVLMIANLTGMIQMSLVGAQRVFEIVDTPVEVQSPPDAIRLDKPQGRVEFERIGFKYNDGEQPVLTDVSFTAEPGQCIAILGGTGSGKSTLLSLIPRFYDVTQGRLLIDGHDVRNLDLDDLRKSIGIVFQESFLFSNTVAANIAFGHPDATSQQITKAAEIASAHGFISELSNGYDTVIGENGVDLSGGQRQRLSIARAILLEPAILLLDDPTAAIDPQTEHEILAAMESAMEGRTTFVVAHRLSTLRRADKVIVLENGTISQVGTHDELMATDGHYLDIARLQIADPESKRLLGMESEEITS